MTLDVGAHSAASRDDVAIYPYVACAPINSPIFIAYFSSHFPPSPTTKSCIDDGIVAGDCLILSFPYSNLLGHLNPPHRRASHYRPQYLRFGRSLCQRRT